MAINIQTLSKTSNNVLIKDVVRELVTAIMSAVADANDGGLHSIEYELPVSFIASGISKSDAQLIVWSDVVEIITKSVGEGGRGFTNVKLRQDTPEKVYLIISWDNGLTPEDRERRFSLLKKIMIEPGADAQKANAPRNNAVAQFTQLTQRAQHEQPTRHLTPISRPPMRSPLANSYRDIPRQSATMSPLSQWRHGMS